jgi:hypothetical protein
MGTFGVMHPTLLNEANSLPGRNAWEHPAFGARWFMASIKDLILLVNGEWAATH